MNHTIINTDLLKKILSFLKKNKSLKYLDPNIFENIDKNKEISDISFDDYFLEYIKNVPRLDFETVVKISREVYQQYGKENDFDKILERLRRNYGIDTGSFHRDDDNCIAKASENRVLLSGTYYDVVLLCHEIGHKLRNSNFLNSPFHLHDIMDTFFFETPSIVLELAANDHLRDHYGIDIRANELRKVHISSISRETHIESYVFSIVMDLLKKRKLNAFNLYMELMKNPTVVAYLNRQDTSIEHCVEEGIFDYSYDIGYILGNYINNSDGKVEKLNTILKYKDYGITMPFIINESIIKETLKNQELLERKNGL